MWQSILKKERLEIEANPDDKAIKFWVASEERSSDKVSIELGQTELFELLHTFLTINRSFNNESMYYDET